MSPKKTLFLSTLAFVALCAATLAYYLPRLRPQVELPRVAEPAPAEPTPEAHKPDVDRELVQSLPASPADVAPPAVATAMGAAPTASTAPPAAPVPAPAAAAAVPAPPPAAARGPSPELAKLLQNPPIQFEIASATLTASSRTYLDRLAAQLQTQPELKLTIEGHTDSQDRLGKNQQLSEARARAVLDYLVSKGVAAGRLSSTGYGGSRPIADNDTPTGRAKNRRIEFKLAN